MYHRCEQISTTIFGHLEIYLCANGATNNPENSSFSFVPGGAVLDCTIGFGGFGRAILAGFSQSSARRGALFAQGPSAFAMVAGMRGELAAMLQIHYNSRVRFASGMLRTIDELWNF